MGRNVTNVTGHEPTVGERVTQRLDSLSRAERKLARVLLASYPIAGLESVARFAERAGVSPPTVTRFITKLGFRGYPEFQETIRHEVQARLSSPLARYRDEQPGRGTESVISEALHVIQADTIETARVASGLHCNIILFTDPWLSPASEFARQVIVTSVDPVGPFDSMVGAMAVVEAVVASVLNRLGPRAQARMRSLEGLRAGGVLAG